MANFDYLRWNNIDNIYMKLGIAIVYDEMCM